MSDLDVKGVEAARHELHNSPWPGAISNAIRAYIAHVAASPADLRSVLAYDAGLAEGRRQGLEEAAKFVDCGCVERAAVLAAATSTEQRRACGRIPCAAEEAAGIRALKEPKS